MRLYHVTTFEKARYIINEGFNPRTASEEAVDPDLEDEYLEGNMDSGYETTDEQLARQELNNLLHYHSSASFFWSDKDKALELKTTSRGSRYTRQVVITIESFLAPCQFMTGNWQLAEDIFSLLEDNPQLCDQMFDEDDEDLVQKADELDALVKKYNGSIRPLLPEDDGNYEVEVMADCFIPSLAIVAVDDVPAPLWRIKNGRLPRWQGRLPL